MMGRKRLWVIIVLLLMTVRMRGYASADTIDFESPSLGNSDRQLINPYIDQGTGVTFTAEPSGVFSPVVGLVKNSPKG